MRFWRLSAIGNFDFFQGWQAGGQEGPHSFGRRSVVFGSNGSGKTTLGNVFRAIEKAQSEPDQADARLGEVRVELTDGETTVSRPGDASDLPPVLVFNQTYVGENLQAAFDDGDELATPLYVLGERSAELDTALNEALAQIEELEGRLPSLGERVRGARREQEQVVTHVKTDVNNRLGQYAERYQPFRFNVNHVRELLDDPPHELDDEQLTRATANLALSLDRIPEPRQLPDAPDVANLAELLATFSTLEVMSRPIERLAGDRRLADWAQQGLEFHEPGDQCGFCASAVRHERITALQAHFDDSYRRFQEEAAKLRSHLEVLQEQLSHLDADLAALEHNDGSLANQITEERSRIGAFVGEIRTCITAGHDLLRRRLEQPFGPVAWTPPPYPESSVLSELAEAADIENAEYARQRENIQSVRDEAATQLRSHIAALYAPRYREANQELEAANSAQGNAETELDGRRANRDVLRAQIQAQSRDGEKLARDLTADLQHYLGHRQLAVEFRANETRSGFVFLRNGQRASGLSEGERGAVALLYFLRSLDSDELTEQLGDTCVVIDDPVSSFDQDALLAAFSFLRRRLEDPGGQLRCVQVILLTHNFEFFRLWSRALETSTGKDARIARESGCEVHELRKRRAALLHLRALPIDEALTDRSAELRELSPARLLSSEYYLLFSLVCEATQLGNEHAALQAGNTARRLLESFLRFKRPALNNFTEAVEQAGAEVVAPETRERVIRALHRASHREDVNIDDGTYYNDVVNDLRAALAFIASVDSEHYHGLVEATGASPELGVHEPQSDSY